MSMKMRSKCPGPGYPYAPVVPNTPKGTGISGGNRVNNTGK